MQCVSRRFTWKYLFALCIVQLVFFIVISRRIRKEEGDNGDDNQMMRESPAIPWFNSSRTEEGAVSDFSALGGSEYDLLRSVFNAGRWKSDSVSPLHTHYDINCSAILSGHNQSIEDAEGKIRSDAGEDAVSYPSDKEVSRWPLDCVRYQKLRRFPERPQTHEESAYPLAYILTVHKHAAQVERLFRALYHPQNVYCFHVDVKAPKEFLEAIQRLTNCFDNAFIASALEDVQYRGYTRLKADFNCMSDLMSYKWYYVINLCGEDFPLKTNLEIVRQMKAYGGKNDIPGVYPKQDRWFVERTRMHHEFVNGELVKQQQRKPPPPHRALIYFGNAYYAATRQFVEHVLTNVIAQDILEYLADVNSPDEHYWVTINRYPGVPGGYTHSTWASNIRFIKWTNSDEYAPCVGKWVRAVCIIGIGYLPYVARQPHLFMNKVHYEYDPLPLQCMEEILDYRTKVPNSLGDFVSGYPVTDLFQISRDKNSGHLYRFMSRNKHELPMAPATALIIVFVVLICLIFLIVACVFLGCCEEDQTDLYHVYDRRERFQQQRFKNDGSI